VITDNYIVYQLPDGREIRRRYWRVSDPIGAMMRTLLALERAVYRGRWSHVIAWSESPGGGRFLVDYIAPESAGAVC